VGDGLDYPETLDDYAADKFTGLRPWSDDEPYILGGFLGQGIDAREYKCDGCDTLVILEETRLCPSCIMAFEEGDAPEELVMTLGDMLSPLEEAEIFAREPLSVRLDSAFKPYRGFMGR
jgi:hypothetical protein